MTYAIGLTGSIATGKSTVLSIFADLGVPVRSADETVHALYAGRAAEAVERRFPGTVVDGVVDRVLLARQLIAAPERLGDLEALIHPMVREETYAYLDMIAERGADLVVLEIPLLFEAGAPYPLDAIVVTTCDPHTQRRRALSRPGMTVEKLDAILARQIGQDEKMQRADYRIDTSDGIGKTRRKVEAVLADFRARMKDREATR
ncbi:MAG: dephospho-CoA kinase [Alphaproteobacteria bacterium]|nr:dephospho-CoA kinase [Alphaproteobacteria bacterium]